MGSIYPDGAPCSVDGCSRPHLPHRPLCGPHRKAFRLRGSTDLLNSGSLTERYWRRVIRPSDDVCWDWRGTKTNRGYGMTCEAGRKLMVHRVSWEIHHGPIPAGMVVMHTCDNPPCSNPRHLRLGTQRDNIHDMHQKKRGSRTTGRSGEDNSRSKLTTDNVRRIRNAHAMDGLTFRDLALEYGVDPTAIQRVVRRDSWKHVA